MQTVLSHIHTHQPSRIVGHGLRPCRSARVYTTLSERFETVPCKRRMQPVQILVIDPQGHKKGLDSNGIAYDTITNATAHIEGGNNEFTVLNPLAGTYTLVLYGAIPGSVKINIGYNSGVDGATTEFKETKVYHSAGIQTITFKAQP